MWDADDLPTIKRTPDEQILYKKQIQSYNKINQYEIKRNKQGLKRLLTLKKKQVKTFIFCLTEDMAILNTLPLELYLIFYFCLFI